METTQERGCFRILCHQVERQARQPLHSRGSPTGRSWQLTLALCTGQRLELGHRTTTVCTEACGQRYSSAPQCLPGKHKLLRLKNKTKQKIKACRLAAGHLGKYVPTPDYHEGQECSQSLAKAKSQGHLGFHSWEQTKQTCHLRSRWSELVPGALTIDFGSDTKSTRGSSSVHKGKSHLQVWCSHLLPSTGMSVLPVTPALLGLEFSRGFTLSSGIPELQGGTLVCGWLLNPWGCGGTSVLMSHFLLPGTHYMLSPEHNQLSFFQSISLLIEHIL